MQFPRTRFAGAILCACTSTAFAQANDQALPEIKVNSAPLGGSETSQILTPATVLTGEALRNKLDSSLGATLGHELGVSSSAFGAGASRPIIRGLEGPRVKILQNGMGVADVSGLSNDHAVAVDSSTARQIEILRGPAALLYGSGAIGGLVNVINERIPTELVPQPTGEAEIRLGSVNRERGTSLSVDTASGPVGLHVDAGLRRADDYRIPGNATLGDPTSASGTLPSSFSRNGSIGLGASYIAGWGHLGASVGVTDDKYGIPKAERSFITLNQTRLDVDGLIREPFAGFDTFRFKLGHTDYLHTEHRENGTPVTDFKNRALETRWELTHKPLDGWRGTLGIQSEQADFSALAADGSPGATVPATRSSAFAAFGVEEKEWATGIGAVRTSAGLRLESMSRRPQAALPSRDFKLASYSVGAAWAFAPGYSVGPTVSIAQRAPAIEELYSRGPHESTASFDIGDPGLRKETSRNLELTLQKTEGLVRWKANLFENRVRGFIFARNSGIQVNEAGAADPAGEFAQRLWSQGDATIRGAEAEISYNLRGEGLSLRGFADTSRGTLDAGGNLPLQPATRFGVDANLKRGAWRTGVSVLHAREQNRLAGFESFRTPSYTQLDANLSHTQQAGAMQLTWFALLRNILDQDIRLSTSVLRETAPLPGRNLVVGVRALF